LKQAGIVAVEEMDDCTEVFYKGTGVAIRTYQIDMKFDDLHQILFLVLPDVPFMMHNSDA